jgi:putative transposase
MNNYATDLTDSQWQRIEKYHDTARKREYNLREVWNALLYLLKTGCQWRMLPVEFGEWTAIYYYYKEWRNKGIFELVHDDLVVDCRKKVGKRACPTVGIIDSQSAKTTAVAGEERGFDAGKKIKGRKRHIMVDTLGLIIAIVVHGADVQDRNGARTLLEVVKDKCLKLKKIYADGGYSGTLIQWAKEQLQTTLEIIKRSDGPFRILPKRWVVERTFAWITNDRRHGRDYERLCESSVAFIHLSMIKVMLKRI